MSKANRSSLLLIAAAFLAGIGVALAATPILAHTAAIAEPRALSAFAKAAGLLPGSLFAWDALIVHGIAVALPVVIALSLLFAFVPSKRGWITAALVTGVLLASYVAIPLLFGEPPFAALKLPWWQHGLEASLAVAVVLAFATSAALRRGTH